MFFKLSSEISKAEAGLFVAVITMDKFNISLKNKFKVAKLV